MKHTIQTICLFSSLTLLGLSTNAFGNPQSTRIDPPENSPAISEPEHPVAALTPGTRYTMRMPEPSTKFDCKIRYAMPDPTINYTIRNVRPELNNPIMWGNGWHDGISRRDCPRKLRKKQ